ncbi:MAG TPA: thioredoxin domain-containing protein [Leadbetterella sp.]|nr:thioredoxin domain-containing protein [Leadbetterella sp.]
MKNILIAILFLGIIAFLYFRNNPKVDFKEDTADGVHFQKGNWQQALDLAKKENKLVFLDIYATWCGPCKQLKKYTFADKSAGEFFNKNFVNMALDGEQEEGATLAQKFGIEAYPTLMFVTPEGELITKSAGFRTAPDLINLGKEILANKQ